MPSTGTVNPTAQHTVSIGKPTFSIGKAQQRPWRWPLTWHGERTLLLKSNPTELQLLQPQDYRRQQEPQLKQGFISQLLMSLLNTITIFLCNRDAAQITPGRPHTPASSAHHGTRKGYLLHPRGTLQLLCSWRLSQHTKVSCTSSPNRTSPQHNPKGAQMSQD